MRARRNANGEMGARSIGVSLFRLTASRPLFVPREDIGSG